MTLEQHQEIRHQIIQMVFGTQTDAEADLKLADKIYRWVIGYTEKNQNQN